jgi:hypothetical protein
MALPASKCKECGAPTVLLETREGGTVIVDPYPSRGLYVLNREMKGMKASVAYYPHVCLRGKRGSA